MSFRLIVFDLDGTLVDSRRDIAESANATLVAYGCPPLDEHEIGRMVGDGAPVLVARAFKAAGAEHPRDALERFLSIYHSRLLQHTRPYEGMVDLLEDLSRRASLGVLTNKPRAASLEILDGLDLTRFFPRAHIVGGDGPFPRKPNPTGLQHLMSVAGATAPETMLVGDSIVDWRTGGAAATRVCLARYGFGWETFPLEGLPGDAWAIDRPIDLVRYL